MWERVKITKTTIINVSLPKRDLKMENKLSQIINITANIVHILKSHKETLFIYTIIWTPYLYHIYIIGVPYHRGCRIYIIGVPYLQEIGM